MPSVTPPHKSTKTALTAGFTLIELSIVLVIIGLIVGGILVGQDLIRAAAVRATISQIEKYNTAVNTFRGKYGYLPGDIKDPDASSFSFAARGVNAGQGDGNGVIEGNWGGTGGAGDNLGWYENAGETLQFWADLSQGGMIAGQYPTAIIFNCLPNCGNEDITTAELPTRFPVAALAKGNYIYAYSANGINYFGLAAITSILEANSGQIASSTDLNAQEAYSIDAKIDDGKPQSGNVTAQFIQGSGVIWAAAGGSAGASPGTAATGSSSTCYDNGGNAANPMQYSLAQNGGAGLNCALSFRFQ